MDGTLEQFDFVADRIPFQFNNYGLLKTELRWPPMVLFSYNRIYRDQTLPARITHGMFVASY